jgi:hypothetical protein
LSIEAFKPVPVRTVSRYIEVFKDLHWHIVTYTLPYKQARYWFRLPGRDDSHYAAFILKWLTPHSVPSA